MHAAKGGVFSGCERVGNVEAAVNEETVLPHVATSELPQRFSMFKQGFMD